MVLSASMLLTLGAIVLGAAAARALLARLGQPTVLGELLLGLALGPSLLGWAWPAAQAALLPAEAWPFLEALGAVGLVLFMFQVGADLRLRRGDGRSVLGVAAGGLMVPLAAGAALAAIAAPWFFAAAPTWRHVALVACVLGVSALPVLGRILHDLGLERSRVGSIALGAGAADDLVAAMGLAVIVGGAGLGLTGSLGGNVALLLGAALALLAAEHWAPLLGRWVRTDDARLALLLGALFGAAWLAHAAGLHAVMGALAVGVVAARHPALLRHARRRLEGATMLLLLPAFFVSLGLKADLTTLGGAGGLVAVAVVLGIASLAKLGGAWLGGVGAGLPSREAFGAGLLLNARGAVGLVVAAVGLEAGLLAAHGYALLVVVVVLTTCLAPPLAQAWLRPSPAPAPGSARVEPIPAELRLGRAKAPRRGAVLPLGLARPERGAEVEAPRPRARPPASGVGAARDERP